MLSTRTLSQPGSSSPLVSLVVRTLEHTSGYVPSAAVLALLEQDYELLAALQRLAFAALAQASYPVSVPARASRLVQFCPCRKNRCTYPDCPLGDPARKA